MENHNGVILAIEILVLLIMLICLRVYEHNNQISTVISIYKISKVICGMIAAVTLASGLIQYLKRKKLFLIYVLMLLLVPGFYVAANGRIPGRYEKLYRVSLIRDGRWEQLKGTMDYFVYHRTEYGGESGNEDVLFLPDKEERTEVAYYKYAYLYSEDDRLDAYTGVWENTSMWHVEDKWYKVELRLFI